MIGANWWEWLKANFWRRFFGAEIVALAFRDFKNIYSGFCKLERLNVVRNGVVLADQIETNLEKMKRQEEHAD